MSKNIVVNGVTYNDVESIEMTDAEGNPVMYYDDAVRYNPQSLTEAQKAQARANIGALAKDDVDGVLMFISPDGSDSNDGLTANAPKKTVKACVNAGATRISAKRGVYNEVIALWNVGTLEIFPTDNDLTYAVGTEREPIVFDTSDSVAVSSLAAYNSIKRVTYSNSANTQFDKVFTKKSLPPIANEYGQRYNSTIWLLSGDEKTVCIKLKPVLTVAECEAETNTFTYVSGYIYINADMSGVEKIIVPTNWDSGFYVNGAEKVKLCEVEVRFSGTYNFDIKNCAYFDLYKCSAKYTSYASGFHPINSNGRMTACYATKNFDGFGVNGYGHTTFVDCVSEFNFDDGMSHHEGCEGTVIGGRYEGNGKGGNAPAYGAKVNIYGGIYKDNATFGVGYLWASGLEPASGTVQGSVMVGNPIGLSVNANCNVIAANCLYDGNTKETENKGNLVEYNANFVRSVNGVLPDEDGNVTVSVGGLPYTNLLPLATDTSDAIYNGTGYMNGNRLNSSAVVKPQSGCGHTGFIRAIPGGVLRFKNIPACTEGYGYIHYFAGDKTTVAFKCVSITATTFAVDENGVYSYTLANYEAIEYIRFSYGEMSEESIITIDEEITD